VHAICDQRWDFLDEGPENEGGENLLAGAQQCCRTDSAVVEPRLHQLAAISGRTRRASGATRNPRFPATPRL